MLYILIVLTVVIGEHYIKNNIEKNRKLGDRQELLGGRIIIQKYHNEGAFLNFMEEKKEWVKTISFTFLGLLLLLFVFMLPKKGNKLFKIGLSLLLGGAISNVADRFRKGYVIDYFTINYKKLKTVIFNFADMAIFLGSIFISIASLLSSNKGK